MAAETHANQWERIDERLRALELQSKENTTSIESGMGNLSRLVEEVRDIIRRHDTMFFGSNGNVGLVTRLDRLEQSEKTRKWAMHAIGATAFGLVVKVLWDVISTHGATH